MTVLDPQEHYIEAKVIAFAKARGWLIRKLQWIGRRGAPDRIFMKDGLIVFVEFKQRGKKPSEIQVLEHQRMRDHGMTVHVIDNIEAGCAIFA